MLIRKTLCYIYISGELGGDAVNSSSRARVMASCLRAWSPKQIAGWLKLQYPHDESMRVSHETIYRSLFIQARGVLKKELIQHLRSKRRIRRSRHSRDSGHRVGQIVDAISIRERPAEIEDRAIPGHWEGDLLGGTKNSHIATLVERHSRFTLLVKVSEIYRCKRRPKTMSPKDRRATQRFEPKSGNHITYAATSAVIRDLSLEGVFVCDLDPLPVGSEIIFTLRAGDHDIALEGIVRHSVDQEGMGIQFTKVSPESKRRLRIHIASLVPAPSKTVKT